MPSYCRVGSAVDASVSPAGAMLPVTSSESVASDAKVVSSPSSSAQEL
jgi:hypothetical protein